MADAGRFVADALAASGILDSETSIAFAGLFSRYVKQQHSKKNVEFVWTSIRPPSEKLVVDYPNLDDVPEDDGLKHELLKKVAIVKLNGGLGSSMGCVGPKSAIPVRGGLSFLDLTVRQVEWLNAKHGVDIPLVLMNSFRTHQDTISFLNKYSSHNISITCFVQSCYPRLYKDTYTPVPMHRFEPGSPGHNEDAWYPPGHGDLWRALSQSGVLDALISQGKEYIFISNIDNLAASVDLRILHHMVCSDSTGEPVQFCMEVVDRTRGDVQGGTLVEYEGRARLIEQAQVPPEQMAAYKSLKAFNHFNTNNLWVRTSAVRELATAIAATAHAVAGPSATVGPVGVAGSALPTRHFAPPVVVNERYVNGRAVLELETAAGAAVEFFNRALGIRVPRSRFLPVKSTSDLLSVQSNLFEVRHGLLQPNPARGSLPPPVIKLGPEFANLSDYNERFGLIASSANGWSGGHGQLPDLLDLEHLTVQGNVYFLSNVGASSYNSSNGATSVSSSAGSGSVQVGTIKLSGTVIIVASDGSRIDVPPGSVLENKVLSGSLRILDH